MNHSFAVSDLIFMYVFGVCAWCYNIVIFLKKCLFLQVQYFGVHVLTY